jgi:RNA polymerase sigma factor (sigma-70 family)
MSRQNLPLEKAYQQYKDSPTADNYETFGESLMRFVQATVMSEYGKKKGSRFEFLEDATSDALIRVLGAIQDPGIIIDNIATYAYGASVHACIDLERKEQGQMEAPLTPNIPYESKDREGSFSLEKLLPKLSEREQQLVQLKLEGLKNKVIAERLDTTEGYIEIRWDRLQKKLRTLVGGN